MRAACQRIGQHSLVILDNASQNLDYGWGSASEAAPVVIRKEGNVVNVKVEKFVDGKRDLSFSVPVFVLRIANVILPAAALDSMARRGLNVRQLVDAKRTGASYTATMRVRERGVEKKVVVSLEQSRRRHAG
jgi:hypothetical protein